VARQITKIKVSREFADLLYVTPPTEIQAPYSPGSLVSLVRDFDRDAVAHRRRISDFLQYQPELFYTTTIEILKKDMDSRAVQFLVTLLVSQNFLFRALCDAALDRDRATALALQAVRVDPLVDIGIARQLADVTTDAPDGADMGMAERLMEILDEVSDGKRILPSLMRMLRNTNPYLRSKAVLMIGRGGRSLNWIKRRLEEADTRVRANAVEALWGMDTPEARELLDAASRDSNNRVAGNALLGLYWLGESSPLAELVKMAGHASPTYRRTAAWVMGETGDPRFSEVLGRMLADSQGEVRKRAFAAVGRIRAAVAQVSEAVEWPVACSCGPKDPRTGQRRVSVAVVSADGRESPRILPAQFMLSEDGQPVWSYRVLEKPAPEAMSVIFLFPRSVDGAGKPWDQGALRCLNWKRSTDLWCTVPYSGLDNTPSAGYADLEIPSFVANSVQAARAFQQTPKRADCTGFWIAVRRAVQPGKTPVRGNRHMIVLAPAEVGDNPDDDLVAAVQASRTSIQVVSTAANTALQDFCRRTSGQFHLVEEAAAIEQRVSLAYLNLLARYEIRYQSVAPDGATLKLRVHSPSGRGETIVPLPGEEVHHGDEATQSGNQE
jgi:HEAT repeat protein